MRTSTTRDPRRLAIQFHQIRPRSITECGYPISFYISAHQCCGSTTNTNRNLATWRLLLRYCATHQRVLYVRSAKVTRVNASIFALSPIPLKLTQLQQAAAHSVYSMARVCPLPMRTALRASIDTKDNNRLPTNAPGALACSLRPWCPAFTGFSDSAFSAIPCLPVSWVPASVQRFPLKFNILIFLGHIAAFHSFPEMTAPGMCSPQDSLNVMIVLRNRGSSFSSKLT